MSEKILEIKGPINRAERIIDQQYHTYTPYTTSYNDNDEIRIVIQSQDVYVLPSESYLLIDLTVLKQIPVGEADDPEFAFNFIAHLFSEMRYELNGFEIDRCRNPGITSLLKNLVACKTKDAEGLDLFTLYKGILLQNKTYQMVIPLRFVFGFCDDFNKIILNSKHELILVRSRSDNNAYNAHREVAQITVNRIQWKIHHVTLSDGTKYAMLKTLERNDDLPLAYRSWDLYDLPALPETTRHNWTVKTTTQLTKPRYVIVALQTSRNFVINHDVAEFDHCKITDINLIIIISDV